MINPRNILIIDFGQLGDVVLSLPALAAVRQMFPRAHITIAVGRAATAVVELAGLADDVLPVDRVGLRDGAKLLSIIRIGKLVGLVRRRKFDFVIDLHSLSETNLLGFLSGARHRLYARRPGRSLNYLSNFQPQPPVEDRKKHAIDRYLDVIKPLKVGNVSRVPRLPVRPDDDAAIDQILKKMKAPAPALTVGMFPGAGHSSRRWPIERFAELARKLESIDAIRVAIFAGPEERTLVRRARALFPSSTIVLDQLTIPQLAAAVARLAVFISNDTGPMHIAAAVGTPVVVLMEHHPMADCYVPLGERHQVIRAQSVADITTAQAYDAVRAALTTVRLPSLFAS